MSYSVRHQIFLSSTYTDLREERAEVLQAIWELDCIPTGMEAFVASNESQWAVIKRVIDECDYYVLIIGGRYGSTTDEGISYTEKEYNYAKEIGLPVLAFVHRDPDQIAAGKTERDAEGRKRLDAFRARVMEEHPVGHWSQSKELGGIVSRALVREIKINPRPGWIRNDGSSPVSLLEQINELNKQNQELREKIVEISADSEVDSQFSGGVDEVVLFGRREVYKNSWESTAKDWNVKTTWDEIFKDIGPALINEASSLDIQRLLIRFNSLDPLQRGEVRASHVTIAVEAFNAIIVQFRALGLIDKGVKKRGVNDTASYWSITQKGDRHLVNILARKREA